MCSVHRAGCHEAGMSDDARLRELQIDWDNEYKRERWNTAGELAAERKPLPELAVVDDPQLRHDAAVAAQNASDAAGRMEKAVARGLNLTEAAGIRPLPMHELTPEERAAARRM